MHGNKEVETAKNIRKREVSVQQLLVHLHDMIGTTIPSIKGLIIGGDFGLRVGYRHLRTNDLDC
ncbi:MAG TPA: hypothetical protein VGM65_05785 [Candidatus Udaeobacter sp.]